MKRWWVSWHGEAPFTLRWPWWISGFGLTVNRFAFDEERERLSFCAAVIAPDRQAAADIIVAAHDTAPRDLEWRFLEERPDDWSPFSERFPKANWMKWPSP